MTSIHGHDVLHWAAETQRSFSNDELVAAVTQQFGTDTRFHTCSAGNLTAKELVDFLQARGKLGDNPHALRVDRTQICQH